jgi:amidohydrolase
MKQLQEIARGYKEKLVEYRRYLHAHPELTNQEVETSAWIRKMLYDHNIPIRDGIRGNSVVAYIEGGVPGPCIAFRADMDALPVQEMNDVPYKSTVPGVMHACGHDAHTAILMCLAQALAENREMIKGKVIFLFQQAEEGGRGGEKLVQDGALDGVDRAFALHVGPNSPVGTITTGIGVQNASSDTFSIEITGKGTHGALPHEGIDPITTGCTIVSEINLIKSKFINPMEQFVVNVCQFSAGQAENVVPEKAVIKGTVRCFSESVRQTVAYHIKNISQSICTMRGCSCEIAYHFNMPCVVNSEMETMLVMEAVREQGYTVNRSQMPQMVSEDFAYILQKVPGCMFGLAAGNAEKGIAAPNHSPYFDIDEDCLLVGLESMLSIYRKASGCD